MSSSSTSRQVMSSTFTPPRSISPTSLCGPSVQSADAPARQRRADATSGPCWRSSSSTHGSPVSRASRGSSRWPTARALGRGQRGPAMSLGDPRLPVRDLAYWIGRSCGRSSSTARSTNRITRWSLVRDACSDGVDGWADGIASELPRWCAWRTPGPGGRDARGGRVSIVGRRFSGVDTLDELRRLGPRRPTALGDTTSSGSVAALAGDAAALAGWLASVRSSRHAPPGTRHASPQAWRRITPRLRRGAPTQSAWIAGRCSLPDGFHSAAVGAGTPRAGVDVTRPRAAHPRRDRASPAIAWRSWAHIGVAR